MSGQIKILLSVALVLVTLIVVVVIVGLAQGTLDTTGTATMLGGVLTGIVGTIVLWGRNGGDK